LTSLPLSKRSHSANSMTPSVGSDLNLTLMVNKEGKEMEEIRKRANLIASIACLTLLLSVLTITGQGIEKAYAGDSAADLGKKIFEERCMVCHGDKGNGKGPVGIIRSSEKGGRILMVRPRDFTTGVFRFRSTPTGCMPTDNDLLRLVDLGIPRSFMPSHKNILSSDEKKAVIEYIKTFAQRWKEETPCDAIPVKKPKYVGSRSSVEKGLAVYKKMKCWECHGDDGRGGGSKADKIKDDWGNPIPPFNFTTGALKRGGAPEDVYITFTTGLDGTGMPSYEDSLNEEERWNLVSYTLKLMGLVK
jgi:mono/diheme cytochrome c family protein